MTINLPPDLLIALKQYAKDNGISESQAIEEILHYFLRVKP